MHAPFCNLSKFASAMSVYLNLHQCSPVHSWKFTYPSVNLYLFVCSPFGNLLKCSAALCKSIVPHYTFVQCRTALFYSAALYFLSSSFGEWRNNCIFAAE